jgi:hypothetical protein
MIEYIDRKRLVLQEQNIQLQMFDIDELVSKDMGRVSKFFFSSYFLPFRYHFLENEWQLNPKKIHKEVGFIMRQFYLSSISSSFFSSAERSAFERSRIGPCRTISDARVALAINGAADITIDVVEAAFRRDATLIVAVGERDAGATELSKRVVMNLRQARSILLRSLE